MPKLINKIITEFEVEYVSVYPTYHFYSNLENFKTINLTQNLSNGLNFESFEVQSFGIKREFFNNEFLIVDGNEL